MATKVLDWFDSLKAKHWFYLCLFAVFMGQLVQWYDSVAISTAEVEDPTTVTRIGEQQIHIVKLGEEKAIYFSRYVCSDGETEANIPRIIKSVETETVVDTLPTIQYTPQRGCHEGKYSVVIDTTKRNAVGGYVYKPGFYRYCPEAFYRVKYESLSHGDVYVSSIRKFLPNELFEVTE